MCKKTDIEKLRVTSVDCPPGANSVIICNGRDIFWSNDGVSCPVIWNNLTGVNFCGEQYKNYIEFMTSQQVRPGLLEFRVEGKVIRKTQLTF